MAPLNFITRKIFLNSIWRRYGRASYRFISTTERKPETSRACEPPETIIKKDFSKPIDDGNWVSYGCDENDKGEDRFKLHVTYFLLFSYILCGCSFIFKYCPDRTGNEWARREAFIRLHEREQLGLEPIDPNFIDPSKIVLPPDEELTDDDIVI